MGDPLNYWDFANECSSGSNTGNPPPVNFSSSSNQPSSVPISTSVISAGLGSLVSSGSNPASVGVTPSSTLGKTLLYSSNDHSAQVLGGFNHLWGEGALCDVILIAESRRFEAHRVVLASCSHYFRTMFTRDFQESQLKEIELKGVTALGLRAVLDFVYTSRLNLSSTHIHDILQTASSPVQ